MTTLEMHKCLIDFFNSERLAEMLNVAFFDGEKVISPDMIEKDESEYASYNVGDTMKAMFDNGMLYLFDYEARKIHALSFRE